MGPGRFDHDGRFSEMVDLDRFVPRGATNSIAGRFVPPWPDDAVGRLVFLIRNWAQLWVPTAAERDEAFAAAYPDAPIVTGQRILPLGAERCHVVNQPQERAS